MKIIKEFFARKGTGFYIACAAALLAIIEVIVYAVTFSAAENTNLDVHFEVWLPTLFAVLVFVGLCLFKVTEDYAAAALFGLEFISFLTFVLNGYMYLTDVFFNGVTAEAFTSMNGGYAFCVIAYLLILVLSGAGVFVRQTRKAV